MYRPLLAPLRELVLCACCATKHHVDTLTPCPCAHETCVKPVCPSCAKKVNGKADSYHPLEDW